MPKRRRQTAALPYRIKPGGELQVLLLTSRDTGRWVLPKGWPMPGKQLRRAAEIEAYEEGGVVGRTVKKPIGTYDYDKIDGRKKMPCRVHVFPMPVDDLLDEWPEQDERRREWFAAKDAAKKVDEKELRSLLARLKSTLDL
ncbi:NUDIX domain-containing protein [Fulvimarina endophytica]|uniref:NUDIX domain-containing protein n=1 Tax=Fulvimarina endophytica TaxID=2293836 RepID=A0A371X895_9HYPH|nr:NUDIX hydrolase [Fulvimarina endophytica]RFC65428.1 NUDIX domain-containing protein [Fulvimarina endophytica]